MIAGYYAVDFQTHSFRSHDGKAKIAAHCARAVEIGLDEIAFTEHKDFDPADPVVDYFDYDAYLTEIEAARKEYAGRLVIHAGIEIDYQQWFENEIRDWLAAHPFDIVLGSVHYVDRLMLMTPEYNASRTKVQAYRDYFTAVRHSAESGLFDVIAHLEYANRRGLAAWGDYNPDDYREELDALFAAMIAGGRALEINTAGLHQGLGITYPTARTVALYAQAGGKLLSLGSDAHTPDKLAHGYATAAEIARANGLTHVSRWQNRRRTEIPLSAR